MESGPGIITSFSGQKSKNNKKEKKALIPLCTPTRTSHVTAPQQLGVQLAGSVPDMAAWATFSGRYRTVPASPLGLLITEHRRDPVPLLRERRAHWVLKDQTVLGAEGSRGRGSPSGRGGGEGPQRKWHLSQWHLT